MTLEIGSTNNVIVCPEVGEGNPAAALAIHNLLKNCSSSSQLIFLTDSAKPAREFHSKLSTSPFLASVYNFGAPILRSIGGATLGHKMLEELDQTLEATNGNRPNQVFSTQELPFSPLTKDSLRQRFPQGGYMVIPDVEPKSSSIKIMTNTGMIPIVWNEQAYQRLSDLNPILVKPFLPDGFASTTLTTPQYETKIVVKSSGSGMPKEYLQKLRSALDHTKQPYSIYLPHKVHSSYGDRPRSSNISERIEQYYADLLNPPQLLISTPSESVQKAASMGIKLLTLPDRGPHETTNRKWAEKRKISSSLGIDNSVEKIVDIIKKALDAPITNQSDIDFGLGKLSLVDALYRS